ncbi:hypothetical protein DFH28DRAFT_1180888, partial [Melampsora americana]
MENEDQGIIGNMKNAFIDPNVTHLSEHLVMEKEGILPIQLCSQIERRLNPELETNEDIQMIKEDEILSNKSDEEQEDKLTDDEIITGLQNVIIGPLYENRKTILDHQIKRHEKVSNLIHNLNYLIGFSLIIIYTKIQKLISLNISLLNHHLYEILNFCLNWIISFKSLIEINYHLMMSHFEKIMKSLNEMILMIPNEDEDKNKRILLWKAMDDSCLRLDRLKWVIEDFLKQFKPIWKKFNIELKEMILIQFIQSESSISNLIGPHLRFKHNKIINELNRTFDRLNLMIQEYLWGFEFFIQILLRFSSGFQLWSKDLIDNEDPIDLKSLENWFYYQLNALKSLKEIIFNFPKLIEILNSTTQ